MYVFSFTRSKRIITYGVILVLIGISITLFCLPKTMMVSAPIKTYCIVVDAGHGEPDGGAISENGVKEETLNLAIAIKLKNSLEKENFEVIMTRETNDCIADKDKNRTIREMKQSDLNNRVKIANESQADFMISIHMNEFTQKNYWGWQTFYSKHSEEGEKLAKFIQEGISKMIDRNNKRGVLPIDGIKIVDKTIIPVIIVECGFLSNEEDLRLLQTEEYQNKIVEGIILGIEEYYRIKIGTLGKITFEVKSWRILQRS